MQIVIEEVKPESQIQQDRPSPVQPSSVIKASDALSEIVSSQLLSSQPSSIR